MTQITKRRPETRPPDADPLAAMLRQSIDRATDPTVRQWLAALRERGEGGAVTRPRAASAGGEAARN